MRRESAGPNGLQIDGAWPRRPLVRARGTILEQDLAWPLRVRQLRSSPEDVVHSRGEERGSGISMDTLAHSMDTLAHAHLVRMQDGSIHMVIVDRVT